MGDGYNQQFWRSPIDRQECCIYRVPETLRSVNPQAYTPQMVLIGPLHHFKKAEATELAKQKCTNENIQKLKSRYLEYLNMEQQKRIYLQSFLRRAESGTKEKIMGTIQSNEEKIRASYAESTDWIKPPQFAEMILLDSVFIIELFLRRCHNGIDKDTTIDLLVERARMLTTVYWDLILLENQLPYFILEEIYELVLPRIDPSLKFCHLALRFFRLEKYIEKDLEFKHFTDLLRCVRVITLDPESINRKDGVITQLYNVGKLEASGVVFRGLDEDRFLNVTFEDKRFYIPKLTVEDYTEMTLRNVMALEQCHYPSHNYVCDYVLFFDFLIDTEKDVDLLVGKGIIKNWIGREGSIADMVNKLCLGIIVERSIYYDVAQSLNRHHDNFWNKTTATLRRVYFTNLWKGTATIAGIVLLVLTLIQTVASVIPLLQHKAK